jgi:hypothetical protein
MASETIDHVSHTLQLRWIVLDGSARPWVSEVVTERARPALRLTASSSSVRPRTPVTLTLTSGLEQHGRIVRVQRWVQQRWVTVATPTLGRDGTVGVVVTSQQAGTATFRAVLAATALYAEATTALLRITTT